MSLIVNSGAMTDSMGKALSATITLTCAQLILQDFPYSASYATSSLLTVQYFTLDMITGQLILYFNLEIEESSVNLINSITLSTSREISNNTEKVCILLKFFINP